MALSKPIPESDHANTICTTAIVVEDGGFDRLLFAEFDHANTICTKILVIEDGGSNRLYVYVLFADKTIFSKSIPGSGHPNTISTPVLVGEDDGIDGL